jgi:hypothetical protein
MRPDGEVTQLHCRIAAVTGNACLFILIAIMNTVFHHFGCIDVVLREKVRATRQRDRRALSRAAWRVRWFRSARLGALWAASAYSRAAVARSPSRSWRYAPTAA